METSAATIKTGPFEFLNTVHRNDPELWNKNQKARKLNKFSKTRTVFDQFITISCFCSTSDFNGTVTKTEIRLQEKEELPASNQNSQKLNRFTARTEDLVSHWNSIKKKRNKFERSNKAK